MPPTLKDSAFPTSPETREHAGEKLSSNAAGNSQPVALEVPVTVNGVRTVAGQEKREPFSETTSTVLVLADGAVIRLSLLLAPGQLLFLVNEKTKREVVCQVVKSKNDGSPSGYVELEFTQPVLGFWGMRFPGDRNAPQAGALPPSTQKSEPDPATADLPTHSAAPKSLAYADPKPLESVTPNLADAVTEFKTEIKADSRASSKADFLAPAEQSIDSTKPEANRLQEQLSALLLNEQKENEGQLVASAHSSIPTLGDAAAKIFDMAKDEPSAAKKEAVPAKSDVAATPVVGKSTPQLATSSFEAEEVKVPAWLEPLARNASIPAPPVEAGTSDSATEFEEPLPNKPVESSPAPKRATATEKRSSTPPKPAPAAQLFANSLLGNNTPALKLRGSGKGIWIAIAAVLIAAAASGAWYFRDSLASFIPAKAISGSNASSVPNTSISTSAPVASAAISTPASPATTTPDTTPSPSATKVDSARALTETSSPVSSASQGTMQSAAITERVPKSSSVPDAFPAESSAEIVESEIKKPSLGKVRLKKPKIGHSATLPTTGVLEPSLEESSEALATGENPLGENFAASSRQPAAPAATVPIGGDVKPARMISSVPPTYPLLAKTQHVAGDVRVDALIDASGRVTTMKIISGPSLLHQAARDSLRQWKYQPATLDGKPVPMHLTVTIQFRLQ